MIACVSCSVMPLKDACNSRWCKAVGIMVMTQVVLRQTAYFRRLRMKALASALSMSCRGWPSASSQGRLCLPPIIRAKSVALTF